ncbi:ribonuclease III [Pseudoduganella sp. R-34]|uniref:ribonuclease III n=1 Tax=Pseudoduganella sp. R-34 TaxID=3404062 RepID=UPI003CF0EA9D
MIALQTRLGYTFTEQRLLAQALTHRSCGPINNERMEFIGDALLNMIAALFLFEKFPGLPEGILSRSRAALVREETLVKIGSRLGIDQHMRVDHQDGSKTAQPSMIADAVEALFGAIYMDGGMNAVTSVVRLLLIDSMNRGDMEFKKDPKTALQELLQGKGIGLPTYTMIDAPNRSAGDLVKATCKIRELGIETSGEGPTKKRAEADAASKAIQRCQLR